MLIRNVTYEGPALRRQLAKVQQLQQELSRREVECQSSAASMKERYYAACKQYGISVSTRTPAGDRNGSSTERQSEHRSFYFIGRQRDSGDSGSGQRLACGS